MKKASMLVLFALTLAACGGGASGPTGSAVPSDPPSPTTSPTEGTAPPQGRSILPSVQAIDVRSGARVDVKGLSPSVKPLLLWFWAPHCPSCNREAPNVVRFFSEHGAKVDIVGLGTQDDLAFAKRFVKKHKVPFRMLWDPSHESWRALNVPGQPSSLLLAPHGEPLASWIGPFDERELLQLIEA